MRFLPGLSRGTNPAPAGREKRILGRDDLGSSSLVTGWKLKV